MWTSTRGGGLAHVDRGEGGQKSDFFVNVINGWPLNLLPLPAIRFLVIAIVEEHILVMILKVM